MSAARTSLLFILLTAVTAGAQTIPGDYEAGVSIRRARATSLGNVDANETSSGGGAFRLFATESELDGATGVDGRFGIRLTETLQLEASGSYAVSDLSTRISSDVEGIPDVTAVESIQQYTVEGAIVMHLPRWRFGARALPFVAAGGGYLRHRHEDKTLVENGGLWHVGGGANLVLRSRPDRFMKALGVRLDARAIFRTGGVAFDDDTRFAPAFGLSAFVRF